MLQRFCLTKTLLSSLLLAVLSLPAHSFSLDFDIPISEIDSFERTEDLPDLLDDIAELELETEAHQHEDIEMESMDNLFEQGVSDAMGSEYNSRGVDDVDAAYEEYFYYEYDDGSFDEEMMGNYEELEDLVDDVEDLLGLDDDYMNDAMDDHEGDDQTPGHEALEEDHLIEDGDNDAQQELSSEMAIGIYDEEFSIGDLDGDSHAK